MKVVVLVLSLFSMTALAAPSKSQTYQLNEKLGSVQFLAVGRPSALKIKGEGEAPRGELKEEAGQLSGQVHFNLSSLKTGISMRDDHMKNKYLEVEKHPTSTLTLDKLELPKEIKDGTQTEKEGVPFTGKLLLHGESRDVQGTYNIKKVQDGFDVSAKLNLKLSDYKINIPSYAGITVAENIDVEIKTTAKANL